MKIANLAPFGVTLLRVTQGGLFLGHAGIRYAIIGMPVAEEFFGSLGLPRWTAELVTLAEAVGGLALVLGVLTRSSALLLAVIMVGTIALVHGRNGFLFTNHNGGWEYPLLWTTALTAQALMGPGKWALLP